MMGAKRHFIKYTEPFEKRVVEPTKKYLNKNYVNACTYVM